MKFHVGVVAIVAALSFSSVSSAALFEDNFDVDSTANWTKNSGPTAGDPTDNTANIFFDYSTRGIPSAPNSIGGSTIGMNLQANQDGASLGLGQLTGISVSPTGKSFSGDYKMTFDVWGNYGGPFPLGTTGTTQVSTFGIGTAGTTANYVGTTDALFFAATLDGGSGADYRAYSIERPVSYQVPADPAVLDGLGQPVDGHAVYAAGSRNNSNAYYAEFGNTAAPAAQQTLYPQQTGNTAVGTFGMEWHEVEIIKTGNIVEWKADGVILITVDITNIVTPLGGGNILFGHSDTNAGASADPLRAELIFTLIDNVKVEEIVPVTNSPDFNGNDIVDAADYTIWADHNGLMDTATQLTGDANGDLDVTTADYDLWKAQFGTSPGSGGLSLAGVPEPSTLLLVLMGAVAMGCGRRR